MYWKIGPYHLNLEADYCVMPADTGADDLAALEYAQARIEDGWNELKPGGKSTVTVELCEGDMPEDSFEPDA